MSNYIKRSHDVLLLALNDSDYQGAIIDASMCIINAFTTNNKLMICGNGGSAADAQHIAGELVGTFTNRNRPGLPAIALTTDSSIITAVGNDFAYERVFARQVAALARPGDVLLALSTSGNSENVYRAVEQAALEQTYVIAMTGNNEQSKIANYVVDMGGILIKAPSDKTPLIQQLHQVAYHAICEAVENYFT